MQGSNEETYKVCMLHLSVTGTIFRELAGLLAAWCERLSLMISLHIFNIQYQ